MNTSGERKRALIKRINSGPNTASNVKHSCDIALIISFIITIIIFANFFSHFFMMMIITRVWLLDYNYDYCYRYHRYHFRQISSVSMRHKSRRLSLLPLARPKLKSKMAAIKTESSCNMTSYLCTGPRRGPDRGSDHNFNKVLTKGSM